MLNEMECPRCKIKTTSLQCPLCGIVLLRKPLDTPSEIESTPLFFDGSVFSYQPQEGCVPILTTNPDVAFLISSEIDFGNLDGSINKAEEI